MTKIAGLFAVFLLVYSCSNNKTVHPQHKNIVETVYASGKIMADSEYTVYALNSGTVVKKLFKEGDKVNSGQVLYVINNVATAAKLLASQVAYNTSAQNLRPNSSILNDQRIAMENAAIKFSNDSLQYMRLKNLWAQNIGTKSGLDNALANYQTSLNLKQSTKERYASTQTDLRVSYQNAKSQLANSQNDYSNYFIKALGSGTVYQMLKEAGEAVKANEAVAMLGKSSQRLIKLAVDQQDIDKVRVGQQVLLKTDVDGDKIYRAQVTRIYPVMNDADQTFRIDATFVDGTNQPYIHSTVEANIIIRQKSNALIIPRQALLNGDSLLVKQNGQKKTIAVKTGIHTMDEVEIISGLDDQADIIVPSQK